MTEKESSGWGKGCGIAAGVGLLVVLVCGGVVTLLGWSIWKSPSVQRGVQIAGAAMEMTEAAMRAPGTAELRAAGCLQAMVYTPEIVERFTHTLRPDGGVGRGAMPDYPMVMCAVREEAPMTCEQVAQTYAAAVSPVPRQMGVTIKVQGRGEPVCEGVYGPDGGFLGNPSVDQQRIGNMGRANPDTSPPRTR